jgi:hypothetical protein
MMDPGERQRDRRYRQHGESKEKQAGRLPVSDVRLVGVLKDCHSSIAETKRGHAFKFIYIVTHRLGSHKFVSLETRSSAFLSRIDPHDNR